MSVGESAAYSLLELGHQPFSPKTGLLKKPYTRIQASISWPWLEIPIELEIKQNDFFARLPG
jgi:hypothetical protein